MIIRARERKEKRYDLPRSCSLFSASFQDFCLTARAYLNTQKYGLFCSLFRSAFVKLRTQSLKRQSTNSNKSVVGEPTTTTTVRVMNKNQILLEINAGIAAMHDSN